MMSAGWHCRQAASRSSICRMPYSKSKAGKKPAANCRRCTPTPKRNILPRWPWNNVPANRPHATRAALCLATRLSTFREVLCIERNPELLRIAEHNFLLFGRRHIRCLAADSIEVVNGLTQPADWIYIDPARRSKSGQKTVLLSDCEPDMTRIIGTLQKKAGHILVKLSPMLDINAALKQLPGTTSIHVVSTENECKEVLFVIAGTETDTATEPDIIAARLSAEDSTQQFRFTQTEERQAEPAYTATMHNYLYEPDSAILKAGAFKSVAVRYELKKLHPNTHLYTSDTLRPDFCGRIFQIEAQFSWQKNDIKQLRNTIRQANITVRNFPAGTDAVRKKLQIGDGGDIFLFATTLADGTHTLLKARKATQ